MSMLPILVVPTETSSVKILEEDVTLTTAESTTVPTGKAATIQIYFNLFHILPRFFLVIFESFSLSVN